MQRLLIALLAGAASVFAFAPFGVWPLAFVCLALLWWAIDGVSTRRAFATGLVWGIGAFCAGVGWLYVALHRYGGIPAPISAFMLLLFCSYLALYPALAAGLYARLRRDNLWFDSTLAAAGWTAGELLRGTIFTGFPWLAIGYTQTSPSPLAGWAPIFGVYGLSFLLAAMAALLAMLVKVWRTQTADRLRLLCWPVVALLVVLVAGGGLRWVAWTQPQGKPIEVALLQTNIPQDLKWQPEQLMQWLNLNYSMVDKQQQARLVVLPETTLPLLIEHLPQGYLDAMRESVAKHGADLIFGVFTRDGKKIYNSAASLGTAPEQVYHKSHLVPFGEYSPPMFDWFYQLASIPMSDQTRGAKDQAPIQIDGQQIAINICYEDVFGEELLHAVPKAGLLLNMSNLAWYGDSHAQPQHLQMARMRAMETGRPMLRATNTGMTAVVAPDGTVTSVLPAFTAGALQQNVTGYTGLTPYVRWANWPVIAWVIGMLGFACLPKRKTAQAT
ncbi:apolipoprotein N-acyltransferase [Uliginosibacterium gangwonense]|uniref:apolipoprotein N-acyltransferase n=1 Tax=Uliginosibacterium gangwonense TaxID=392736 RepID=UPI0003678A84|nr:apolipoprotein N-acyltransferase [Uliginosibacterium gangwonense]